MAYNYEKIESKLAALHAKLPHISSGGRQWLADNIWWIVLIAAIAGVFGVVTLLLVMLVGGVFLAAAALIFTAKFGGLAQLVMMVGVALALANVVIAILSVGPLKARLKKGWLLLALCLLVGFVVGLLTDLVGGNEWAVIRGIGLFAFGLYILFEIRQYFTASSDNHRVAVDPAITEARSARK